MGQKQSRNRGLTIIELMISMLMSVLLLLAIGVVLFDSERSLKAMYDRATSNVVAEAYVARAAFDGAVRPSTIRTCVIGGAGESLEVYYYNSAASAKLDRYVTFYRSGDVCKVDYGPLVAGTFTKQAATATQTLARNVTACTFAAAGISASMHLVLDNGKESMTVDCTAVRHNT